MDGVRRKPSHRHRHVTTRRTWTRTEPQDRSSPSRRKPQEIIPKASVDCRKHEGKCLPEEELVEIMSRFPSENCATKLVTSESGAPRPTSDFRRGPRVPAPRSLNPVQAQHESTMICPTKRCGTLSWEKAMQTSTETPRLHALTLPCLPPACFLTEGREAASQRCV